MISKLIKAKTALRFLEQRKAKNNVKQIEFEILHDIKRL